MSDQPAEPIDPHPTESLVWLVEGELTLDELRAVVTHVRSCPRCQAELVEVAAGAGALRGIARDGLDDLAEPPPLAVHPLEPAAARPTVVPDTPAPPVPPAGRSRWRTLTLAAAAVLLVLGGVAVGSRLGRAGDAGDVAGPAPSTTQPASTAPVPDTTPEPYATAELVAVGAARASGSIAMSEEPAGPTSTDDQLMEVSTADLGPAPTGHFYEVWLFQPETKQMVPVGVLPDSGTATFALPAGLLANYQAVDISLQADDGTVAHSGDSVLRATYG